MARKTTTIKSKARSARPAARAPRAKKWVYLYFDRAEVAAAVKYAGGTTDGTRGLLGGKGGGQLGRNVSALARPFRLASR